MEPERTRRTQAERRETTRRALLDATIQSLMELGYSRTTTTEVVRRAGFSQGALFKHFPSKSALVAAAAEQLFEDLFTRFSSAFEASVEHADEPAIVLAMRKLWDVFCTKELRAVYGLYAEAPNDPELHASLVPVVAAHQANLSRFALDLFPELERTELHRALLTSVIYAMQGLSFQKAVHVDADDEARMLSHLESLGRSLFPKEIPC